MRGRMGMAVIVLAAAMLAVGCQTPAQKEQKKQMEQEKKMAAAEAKRQKEVAAMDAKHQQEEAKRQAEADKQMAAAEKKRADEEAKANAKLEKEQKGAFGADTIRDEREVRSIDRFMLAQSAAGARGDAMLSDDHFDGGELNSLGRTKLKLIAVGRPVESKAPVVVYLNTTDSKMVDERKAAIESYWKGSEYADIALNVKNGVNDNVTSPAQPNINALKKIEEQKDTQSKTGIMNTPSAGATSAAPGTP